MIGTTISRCGRARAARYLKAAITNDSVIVALVHFHLLFVFVHWSVVLVVFVSPSLQALAGSKLAGF
jgi:hypothetical protein